MPSERPPTEPSAPGSDPANRWRPTGAVRDGTLVFALVLSGFVAYALGASATYVATAFVKVEPLPGSAPIALPGATEATERLRRAALDPALVATLASEERPLAEPIRQVADRIARDLSVESRDGKSFAFAAMASSAQRSQRIVNELAQQAAKRAAQLLDPQPQALREPDPAARAKADLLDFLAAHPSIAAEPAAPVRTGPDTLVLALRAERIRIEEKLAKPSTETVENPYGSTNLEDPEFLKRRLREIDNALDLRAKRSAARAPADSGDLTPEMRAEWQRLVRAVSETRAEPAPAPATRLRVTLARAALPLQPIKPDRPRVVLLGVLISSVAGVLAGLLRGWLEARAVRRYGATTGAHPLVSGPQTTLRLSRSELPKPIAPANDPLPTPIPKAPAQPVMMTPIPPAPIIPLTPIPRAPQAPTPITPIPQAPIAPLAVTSIPPAPLAPTPITPVPPETRVLAAATPLPPPVPPTPIPPGGVAPPATDPLGAGPIAIDAPIPGPDREGPPTTKGYGEPPARPARNAERRITQIYGTPPHPDLEESAKALRTTQAYGSPPGAIPPRRPLAVSYSATPIPAEVLPPPHRSSLQPTPMIPLSRSSVPPAVAPSPRTGAPLAETSYSYVQTPVPESQTIPQTPPPRRPSPPPRTEPYASAAPPVASARPSRPSPPPARSSRPPATPNAPKPKAQVVTHAVPPGWTPEPSLAFRARRPIVDQLLPFAVERCFVIGVTSVPETASQKSRVAAELALALSEAREPRVLLLEADFQAPNIHRVMRVQMPMSGGFSQQLRTKVRDHSDEPWNVIQCKPSLHVLAEGLMRSPGLMLTMQFEESVRSLASYYDFIVIDGPATSYETDCRALSEVLDGVLITAPSEGSRSIVAASELFPNKRFSRVVTP